MGDVLLMGPAVRAIASRSRRVTMLAGPRGKAAAELLPGVDDVICFEAPWIDPEPKPVDAAAIARFDHRLGLLDIDRAVIFTSYHQSPLPLALLLRLSDVPFVAAICEDYPGSLLDVRHRAPDGLHEVERALSLAEAVGCPLPQADTGALAVARPEPPPDEVRRLGRYVVVHPGTSVPARAWPPERHAELIERLLETGRKVVVTGHADEAELTEMVSGAGRARALDYGGRTDLRALAAVLAGADCVVAGNTGPAHLAAAVGTPVVSLFAPTVPASCWRPWGVPTSVLGDQDAPCAGSRARTCPVPGHPCLTSVTALDVIAAIEDLAPRSERRERTQRIAS
jgi:ADP-heptose:LPS heptosyltransferase